MSSPTWLMIAAIASSLAPMLGALAKSNKSKGWTSVLISIAAALTAAIAAGVDDVDTLVVVGIGATGLSQASFKVLNNLFGINEKIGKLVGREVDIEEHEAWTTNYHVPSSYSLPSIDPAIAEVVRETMTPGQAHDILTRVTGGYFGAGGASEIVGPEPDGDFLGEMGELLGIGPEQDMS